MKRHAMRKVEATELVVDRKLNFRKDYDIASMIEEIKRAGAVLEPIHAIFETKQVLKGNRRVTAVQAMLADPNLPNDLRKAIEKLDVLFYEKLTEKEITELVLDHGSQKPLTRVEVLLACWRLQTQMYSEKDICTIMYQLLARYTGNVQQANEAANMPEGPARTKYLTEWLHGTLGNYILAAGRMGDFVREQFILTDTAVDRKLTDEEEKKLVMRIKRGRINQLSSAIKKDRENGSWNNKDHGTEFDAKIAEFIAEDAGTGPSTADKEPKPSTTAMLNSAESMKSSLGLAYLHCAGKLDAAKKVDIVELDLELDRLEQIKATARQVVDRVDLKGKFGGGEVRELLSLFLKGDGPAFASYVERFLTKPVEVAKKEEAKPAAKTAEKTSV